MLTITHYYFEEQDRNDFMEALKHSNMSFRKLGVRLGVSYAYLNAIVKGHRPCTYYYIHMFKELINYEIRTN